LKYWINRESQSNNVVLANEISLLVGSCDKEHYDEVEQQLEAGKNASEVLGTEDLKIIPFLQIQELSSLSTDEDVEVKYKSKKSVETLSIYFQDAEQSEDFVAFIDPYLSEKLQRKEVQKSAVSAALLPVISIIVCLAICYLYYNKLRLVVYVVGGLWVLGSLYNAYSRITNPPVLRRWAVKGKYARKAWSGLKLAYSYAVLAVIAFGASLFMPDRYGELALYESVYEEEADADDVKKFLARGADINYRDEYGDTPLTMSLYIEDDDLSLAIIEAGANLNAEEDSILETALYNDAGEKVIEALLQRGALEFAEAKGFYAKEYAEEYDDQRFADQLDRHLKVVQAEN